MLSGALRRANLSAYCSLSAILMIGTPDAQAQLHPHLSITTYDGPETCLVCHESEALEAHGSVHYQQSGPTDYVTNIDGPAGERGPGEIGINTYCGTHESSPRFTCAGCHVGKGRFPKTPEQLFDLSDEERHQELSNIDCLTCHQDAYKRFPDPSGGFVDLSIVAPLGYPETLGEPDPDAEPIIRTGLQGVPAVDPETLDFEFVPAGTDLLAAYPDLPIAPMPMTAAEAARGAHATTRRSCLNCHAGAGGGDGTKRGDMSSALIDPPASIDVHMSTQGADLTCSDCHDAGGHRMRGRGLDLRPNDVPERFTCENSGCHSERPHADLGGGGRRHGPNSDLDRHTARVACQTCHIPSYAKGVPTEVARDWERPHFSEMACNGRGGWLPEEIRAGELVPTYAWFDGTSEVYYLGEPLDAVPTKRLDDGSLAYVLGAPNGDVDTEGAKLYPMKEHLGKVGRHLASNTLIGHSTFEFFRTGDFDAAIRLGLVESGLESEAEAGPEDFDIVPVHTYQTLNHGVEAGTEALECGACHGGLRGGPARMDLRGELGYELKGPEEVVCTQCHDDEGPAGFLEVHAEHVGEERIDCAMCHAFSRPERGLRNGIVED
jgi:hypothetical protein